jgi:hypothetical protein
LDGAQVLMLPVVGSSSSIPRNGQQTRDEPLPVIYQRIGIAVKNGVISCVTSQMGVICNIPQTYATAGLRRCPGSSSIAGLLAVKVKTIAIVNW